MERKGRRQRGSKRGVDKRELWRDEEKGMGNGVERRG